MVRQLLVWMLLLMIWGCAGYREETKRYHLPAGEGLMMNEVAVNGSKEDLWRATLGWVEQRFYSETMTMEKQDRDQGMLVLQALAPVSGPQTEDYCHFKMHFTIGENSLKTQFETLRMTDQFYPSKKNMSELISYYTNLNNDLKQTVEKSMKSQ